MIQELWPDRLEENLGVLARHHRGAGDLAAAIRCHDLAAERAERLYAGEEAVEHLSASIELSAELDMTVADREVAERVLTRGRIRARTGDAAGARDDLEAILAQVDPTTAPELVMQSHDELGFVLAGAADYRAAVPHLEAALEAATALGSAAGQVSALSRLSIVHANRLDFDAALEHGERAQRSAAASGDERLQATAMDALKQVALETGDLDTLEDLAARLAEIHRRNDDLWLCSLACQWTGSSSRSVRNALWRRLTSSNRSLPDLFLDRSLPERATPTRGNPRAGAAGVQSMRSAQLAQREPFTSPPAQR